MDLRGLNGNQKKQNHSVYKMNADVGNEGQQPAEEPTAVEDITPPTRFEVEIEFVNSLSNINYVNYLIKNKNVLQEQNFLRYLKYLYATYACNIEFKKYIIYPNCLVLLKIIIDNLIDKEATEAETKKNAQENSGEEIEATSVDVDRVLQQLNDPKLFKDMYDRFNEK